MGMETKLCVIKLCTSGEVTGEHHILVALPLEKLLQVSHGQDSEWTAEPAQTQWMKREKQELQPQSNPSCPACSQFYY
jgi:hypothetical protein